MKKRAHFKRDAFRWKPRNLSTVFVAALFATPGVTLANNLFFDPAYKWAPNLEIMGQAGSNETVRGKLVLPLYQDPDSMLFTDLRARDTSDEGTEYNAGLAYRKIMRDRCLIWGVYGFYDYLQSELNNHFDQITVGTEMLSQKWDARVNAYIPLKKKVYDDHLDLYVPIGHNIFAERGFEEAMWGVDGEVGYHMGIGLPTLYVGGYYFANTDVPTIAGPRVHADLKLGDFWRRMQHNDKDNMLDHVDMSLIGQYDSVRGWEGWVEGRLNFDLMGAKRPRLRGLDEMMKERIIRDNAIVTGTFHGPNELLLNKDGNPYYIVYADNVHGSDSNPGTIEKPVASAEVAVEDATGVAGGIYEQPGHSGDYIYLFPNGGYAHPYLIDGELELARNQTIHGGGADFIFHDFPRGDDFTLIKATTSTVIEPGQEFFSDALIELNDNNTVRGLTLDGISPSSELVGIESADDANDELTSTDINNNVLKNLIEGIDLEFDTGSSSNPQNVFINIVQNAFDTIPLQGIIIDAFNDSAPISTLNINISGNTFNNVAASDVVTLSDFDVMTTLADNPSTPVSQLFAVDMEFFDFNGSNVNVTNNKFQDIGGGVHLGMFENGSLDPSKLAVFNTNISGNTIDNFGNAIVSLASDLSGDGPERVLGAQGILIQAEGTENAIFNNTIQHNTLTDGFSNGIEVDMSGFESETTFLNNNISYNDIERLSTLTTDASSSSFGFENGPALSDGIRIGLGDAAFNTLDYQPSTIFDGINVTTIIDNNHIVDIAGHGINVESEFTPLNSPNATTSDFVLKIDNNTIDQTTADGIKVSVDGLCGDACGPVLNFGDLSVPVMQFEIDNNTITRVGNTTAPVGFCDECFPGIIPFIYSDGINVSINTFGTLPNLVTPNVNVTEPQTIVGQINNNTIDDVGFGDGIRVLSENFNEISLGLTVSGNTISHINGLSIFGLEQLLSNSNIEDFLSSGPFTSLADEFAFLANISSGDGISVGVGDLHGTNNITIANNKVNDVEYVGIYADASSPLVGFSDGSLQVNINNNNVNDAPLYGIALTLGELEANTQVNINNNTVQNVELPSFFNSINIINSGLTFGDGIAVGLFNVGNPDTPTVNTVTINGNTTQNTDQAGIALGVFGNSLEGLTVPDKNQDSLVISNNNVSDSDLNGILVSIINQGNGTQSAIPQPLSIIDNTISTIQTGFGIVVNGLATDNDTNTAVEDVNATITGNTVTPNQGPAADKAVCVGEDVSVNGVFSPGDSPDDVLSIPTNLEATNTLHGEVTPEGSCEP